MSDYLDLHALADGQLDGQAKAEAERRLRECPISQAEYKAVLELKSVLADKASEHNCLKTWAGCSERIAELQKRRRVEKFVSKYAWAMCLAITVTILSAGVYNRSIGYANVRAGDVAGMVSSLSGYSQRAGSQSVDLNQFLQESSQGAPVRMPDGHIRLLEVSQGFYEDRWVSVAKLADNDGAITLVTVKGAMSVSGMASKDAGGAYAVGTIDRVNSVCWSEGGFSMFLLGDRSYESLSSVANAIRNLR